MLAEKTHVMGLPNTETGSSMGRKCSVVFVPLDYNKYFCFRGHWKLERGPSHSPFIKTYGWFYSKPYADIIGGEIALIWWHEAQNTNLKDVYLSHASPGWRHPPREYFHYSAGSQNLLPRTRILMRAKAPSHVLYFFFFTTSCLCRGEKPFC